VESAAAETAPLKAGEFKLEAILLAVSDVDRTKEFYKSLGWRLDVDVASGEDFRIVQFTPPGSGCSIQFGTNIASGEPGSTQRASI
jgi:catechol 2,3-dioxygenase-like lactoylglutathione lyase family enzyme